MEHISLAMVLAFLTALICTAHSDDGAHSSSVKAFESSNHESHQPQKRSPSASPSAYDEDLLLADSGLMDAPYNLDDVDKRNTLFRFGKRQGSLFRFGKRGGSLFRFGKRGTLLRFGKRGGSLFRFGRSGPSDSSDSENMEDKRTLFRFGKRSDLDLLRDALAEAEYSNLPVYAENEPMKRDIQGFHWGMDNDEQ
ncbi:unnamed protein product [Lymnaea stagnalis]|uniref:LFRFa n=1 Tax=Lymnaea stagnalis TaxID=6523 RepID=Q5U900_LYMST|nr:LFRFa precursor [Lymnaea stagnalis]